MLVRDLVEEFLAHHRAAHAPDTARVYGQGLAWLVRAFGDRHWEELQRVEVRRALEAACRRPDGKPWAKDTIRRNKGNFSNLQNFLLEELEYPLPRILNKKDVKKPPSGKREKIPTDAELAAVIAAATPAFALVLQGFAASAMRPRELCSADVAMIEPSGKGRVLVIKEHKTGEKTGEDRRIALGKKLGEVIDAAIAGRAEGPIWLDDRGKRWTPRRIRDRWAALRTQCGVAKEIVPYCIRHQTLTKVARQGKILQASKLAGHRSVKMTERYLHATDDDQLDAQAALEEGGDERRAA